MAFDVATLGIAIDARPVSAGATELDKLTAASGRAESATQKLTATDRALAQSATGAYSSLREMAEAVKMTEAAERAAVGSTQKLGAAVQASAAQAKAASVSFTTFYDAADRDFSTQYVRQAGKAAAASKLMGHEVLNLTRQFSDIGVTAAMGMSPLMILIQQGPQIGETLAMAKARGVSFSAALREMALAGWAAVAPLTPFIAAGAALAAVLGGGLLIATHELNKGNENLGKRLGWTAEQMKKAGDTSVTVADVIKGSFKYAAEALSKQFAPQLTWLKRAFA